MVPLSRDRVVVGPVQLCENTKRVLVKSGKAWTSFPLEQYTEKINDRVVCSTL